MPMRLIIAVLIFLSACQEKEFDVNDVPGSYQIAKEPYDNRNYEIALRRLGEFKSRFPYSKYAIEAELLMANAHFELGHYPEATVAYKQFIKLHPRHPSTAFSQFRMGLSYWKDAPEAINREQDLTARAISEWKVLLEKYPQDPLVDEAKKLIEQGEKRIVDSEEFIAKFLCKQEKYHACAYRNMKMVESTPAKYRAQIKRALLDGAFAIDKMLDNKKADDEDSNLFFKNHSPDELRTKAAKFRADASKL